MARALRKGFTLIEVMVAAFLSLLVVGLIATVFVPMLKVSARGTTRIELQQIAYLATERILRDMVSVPPAGVTRTIQTGADLSFALHPVVDYDVSGSQVWAEEVTAYHYDSTADNLTRVLWSSTDDTVSASSPAQLSPPQLATALAGPKRQIIAGSVTEFEFVTGDVGLVAPIRLRLVLEQDVPGKTKPERVEMERRITLRCGS